MYSVSLTRLADPKLDVNVNFCIHPELAKKLEIVTPLPEPMEFSTAEGGRKVTAKTLQAWRLKLDFERDEIVIDPKVTKLWLL